MLVRAQVLLQGYLCSSWSVVDAPKERGCFDLRQQEQSGAHTRPELSSWCCHSAHQITLGKSASLALCLKSETDGLYQLPPSVTCADEAHTVENSPWQITLRATGSKEHKRVNLIER